VDSNVVLTVYLTQRQDPQRKITWPPNCDDTVRTWIRSLERCKLTGVIFHDGLSDHFIDKWENDALLFWPIDWSTPWTAAEERVKIYRDWLVVNDCDWVLTTDLADVEFHRDPFEVMNDPERLYIGSENERIGEVELFQQWMRAAYRRVSFADFRILNPGIVGGKYDLMVKFLGRWLAEMELAVQPTPPPHDITAFNRLIYRERIPFATGHPLHTKFRANQGPESGAAIRHK
jgi:hypothetical protein